MHSNGSPRFCKLVFVSEIDREVVVSHARNLRGLPKFAGVLIRPSLTPKQRQLKSHLVDYRWGTFQKEASGRFPVAVHYLYDRTPYLWHLEHEEIASGNLELELQ